MAGSSKQLSSPISTAGKGHHFEASVQASFVVLLLTGGFAPCLPTWPIEKIKLQGKIAGFDTDDLIITVRHPSCSERRKLLGQVKLSAPLTSSSSEFAKVIKDAWNDFNNASIFTKNKDIIALITHPSQLSHELCRLVDHARMHDSSTFFTNVATARFFSDAHRGKLNIFREHLCAANEGVAVLDSTVHEFLRHFFYLGYDLGEEEGVILALINSHIAQYQRKDPRLIWSRILEFTNNSNHHAGIISKSNFPQDIVGHFLTTPSFEIPQNLLTVKPIAALPHQYPNGHIVTLLALLGAWDEKNDCDKQIVCQLSNSSYDSIIDIARELLNAPNSPLSLKNGIWRVSNRAELLSSLALQLLDHDFDKFKEKALTVLKEQNPAFELEPDTRFCAAIYGKNFNYSEQLRKGIAEGLAIIASNAASYSHASLGKAETTSLLIVRELLAEASWLTWGSLNDLLPALAEAAPAELLDAIERTLKQQPTPFIELYAQESDGIAGRNYMTGLLWALECLAWDKQWLVRVCVVLGELAILDPGGNWTNRPINSIVTILLPWLPQTLATVETREVAVKTLIRECPEIAWNVLLRLLPNSYGTSFGTYKPKWQPSIRVDQEKTVTTHEYWQQVSIYAKLALEVAGHKIERLVSLVESLEKLPLPLFNDFLSLISSPSITTLPELEYAPLWKSLTIFIQKHKRFHDAEWALPAQTIERIEMIAGQLSPTNLFEKYKVLFGNTDYDLFTERGKVREQQKKLDAQRVAALQEIYQKYDTTGLLTLAQMVASQNKLGHSLGNIGNEKIDSALLHSLLNSEDNRLKQFASSYVYTRQRIIGWEWCDSLDRTLWNTQQTAFFLSSLPFRPDTWIKAEQWLGDQEKSYWVQVVVYDFDTNTDIAYVVKKLIEYGRPIAAIDCLSQAIIDGVEQLPFDLCIQALLKASTSSEQQNDLDSYHITSLITYLQKKGHDANDLLCKVEWIYLAFLGKYSEGRPRVLMRKLADEPDFFCDIIQTIYVSSVGGEPRKKPTEAEKNKATMAWHLLQMWDIPPGLQEDNSFDGEHLNKWLSRVKKICSESGHLDIALSKVGEVLYYVPNDPSGLWIHCAAAEVLNEKTADILRDGFRSALYSSRGVYTVDPSGKPERDLAADYAKKAEYAEKAGFHRLADTLRTIAAGYEREAKQVISRFGEDD